MLRLGEKKSVLNSINMELTALVTETTASKVQVSLSLKNATNVC